MIDNIGVKILILLIIMMSVRIVYYLELNAVDFISAFFVVTLLTYCTSQWNDFFELCSKGIWFIQMVIKLSTYVLCKLLVYHLTTLGYSDLSLFCHTVCVKLIIKALYLVLIYFYFFIAAIIQFLLVPAKYLIPFKIQLERVSTSLDPIIEIFSEQLDPVKGWGLVQLTQMLSELVVRVELHTEDIELLYRMSCDIIVQVLTSIIN